MIIQAAVNRSELPTGTPPDLIIDAIMGRVIRARRLFGAHDREVLADEDVVWPVDADVVDVVLAVAELHDAVDDAARVGRQRGFRRLVRRRSADDRPQPLIPVRRDLAYLLGRGRRAALEGDHLRRGSRRSAAPRLHDDLAGRDSRSAGRPQYENGLADGNGAGRSGARSLSVAAVSSTLICCGPSVQRLQFPSSRPIGARFTPVEPLESRLAGGHPAGAWS